MNHQKYKNSLRDRRKKRIRKKVLGLPDRPRMTIFRSLRNIYVQVIDDTSGTTLVEASTVSEKLADKVKNTGNSQAAAKVGEALARKAMDVGIRQVAFDRCGYKYHGRVKALAEAARKAGLAF